MLRGLPCSVSGVFARQHRVTQCCVVFVSGGCGLRLWYSGGAYYCGVCDGGTRLCGLAARQERGQRGGDALGLLVLFG